jgi:hypothetical protein
MSALLRSIIEEVETALSASSEAKGIETLKRVADLYLSSAGSYAAEQVELFDNVLERLVKTIEIRAIADIGAHIALFELSGRLAHVSQAPPLAVRQLARNDEISIAGPVLKEAACLTVEDLVEVAQLKTEQHIVLRCRDQKVDASVVHQEIKLRGIEWNSTRKSLTVQSLLHSGPP